MKKNTSLPGKATTACTVLLTGAGVSHAQVLEEVTVTGTRGEPRTAIESAVPVDVFQGEMIQNQGYNDMSEVLRTVLPSYFVDRFPIADGQTFVRPPTVRNLPASYVQMMVNGKRKNKSPLIADGVQPADASTIPTLAIRNIEVLRDGASAQYGADAIAGVINFQLREDREGGELKASLGERFEGDGGNYTVQGNIGLPLGPDGFINLTGQLWSQDLTENHQNPFGGRERWVALGFTPPDPIAEHGRPEEEGRYFVWNAGLDMGDDMEAYAFGNYTNQEKYESFIYRTPHATGRHRRQACNEDLISAYIAANPVFAGLDPVTARAQFINDRHYDIDSFADEVPALPLAPDGSFDYGTGSDIRLACSMLDDAGVNIIPESISGYDESERIGEVSASGARITKSDSANAHVGINQIPTLLPNGFTPRFKGVTQDFSQVVGVRGETDSGITWDLSGRYGISSLEYTLTGSLNFSLGSNQLPLQRDFDIGTLRKHGTGIQCGFR